MNLFTKRALLRVMMVLLSAGLAMSFGCAKATKETKSNAYKQARDKLQALATKDAKLKAGIDAKLAEFDKEFKEAEKKEGEEAVKAIGAIVSRMNKYHDSLSPNAADKGKPATANDKAAAEAKAKADKAAAEAKAAAAKAATEVKKAAAPPATGHPANAPGGKLGGTAVPPKAPAPAPAAQPQGGSGFGGK